MPETPTKPVWPGNLLTLRIDFADLDLFGHVNNISFLRYIQSGRIAFWERCGMMDRYFEEKVGPILHTTQCRYVLPLYYPGNIQVLTQVPWVGRTSFGMEHRIVGQDGQTAAIGTDVFVMFDFASSMKQEVPGELRDRISDIQGFIPSPKEAGQN